MTTDRPALGRPWRRTLTRILTRDPTCQLQLPGCTHHSQTADHITPRSQGGTDQDHNLRGACHHCNQQRNNRPDPDTDTTRASRTWTQQDRP